jgi:hypothetical protein
VLDAAALAAIEEIKALKARYSRTMDTKDWPAFEAVFAPDATMDVSGEARGPGAGDGIIRGRATIAGFVRAAIDDVTTVHHGHMPEIEIVSESRARGIWAMEDRLRWPDGAPIRSMHGLGHYHETYERRDGRWLIASTRLTRLRVDVELADP